MKESTLHAALKVWYAQPGDQIEQLVEGYVVDILRGRRVIEIQTGSFTNLNTKLARLAEGYDVTIVFPVPVERFILRVDNITQQRLSRRKSPKKARVEEIFKELVYLIPLLKEKDISFEILRVKDEIIFVNDGRGSWRRRRWSIADRKLIGVVDKDIVHTPAGFLKYLPSGLPDLFTTRDISKGGGFPISLSRKMVYCLYQLGLVERSGKSGNSWFYHHL